MPEGDTVFRTGEHMRSALAGQRLIRTDFRHPALATVDLSDHWVRDVQTVGKHVFTRLSNDRSLHSHLRMDGVWEVYRPGRRWRRPAQHARVVLECATAQVVGFRVHDLRLLPTAHEHQLVKHLGPDLIDPQWTQQHADTATRRLAANPHDEIGLALLEQRNLAGIGNLYKVEVCFLLGVTPWIHVSEVDAEHAVALARRLLLANSRRAQRSTTGDFARGRRTWVYERHRGGCFRCGGRVYVRDQGSGVGRRPTWFCPRCQTGPWPDG